MQLQLEMNARKSEERELGLVQRALEAERRTAEAMRAEATAAEEAAAAERAAKFAADSEARELQHEMERLEESLRCCDTLLGSSVCPMGTCNEHISSYREPSIIFKHVGQTFKMQDL